MPSADFLTRFTPTEGRTPPEMSDDAVLQGLDAGPTRRPDAIFIGGGARQETLDAALAALAPGGRLVVHGVTAETEWVLVQAYKTHGGELVRMQVETAAPVGAFLGWTPARAVTQWSITVPHTPAPAIPTARPTDRDHQERQ